MSSPKKNKKKFTIAVEGNIGSGKSTVLSCLEKSPLCDVIPEPIESWTNHKGHNILAMFYDDPHRWAFVFETNALMTLAKLHTQLAKAPVKVMERSIHSARYCFIENLHRSNVLQDVEYQILDDYFEMLISNEACKLDLIIYLRATPKTCLERIRARNRPEETTIDLNYLTTLHRRHEEWLIPRTYGDTPSPPVLIVDANQNKERVYSDTNNHVINLISC
ncbi:unnamed protein product [Adineta steineri]|uniref:Deoxynucleoside kinase domain-containing protein n=1 Tax=Adineta steineri TaxID=433720 RepID=A0A819QJ22_9BILA|nr:unnamed protein product [Adineta steineri]